MFVLDHQTKLQLVELELELANGRDTHAHRACYVLQNINLNQLQRFKGARAMAM